MCIYFKCPKCGKEFKAEKRGDHVISDCPSCGCDTIEEMVKILNEDYYKDRE